MSFELFGFEIIPSDRIFGIWIGLFENWSIDKQRSLLTIWHSRDDGWMIDLFWMRLV